MVGNEFYETISPSGKHIYRKNISIKSMRGAP